MRRGRTGLGGWRNENPRHFRPRGGGTPYFRPPRHYGILDGPRFPPPGLRLIRPPHFNIRPRHGERGPFEHNERNQYRPSYQNHQHGIQNRNQYRDKSGPRHTYPYNHQIRHKENDSLNLNLPKVHENMQNVQSRLINKSLDIDHNNLNKIRDNQNYEKQNLNSSWSIPVIENKKHYENQSPNKLHRHSGNNETSKIPLLDYPGHRPPSSDYYGGNPSPVTNNNTSFSRSVDDTVDIVRKRLLYRNEPQTVEQDCISDQSYNIHTSDPCHSYQKIQSETTTKKKILRQKHTIKSNCDKIKNKIVHQLFKMDKDKIHKLMDNPNSSTKFEYAINSLITESQISLNRHLRSVAEKSLCSSSSDFIQNDSNNIYEDTFMKQMQCILDPQDTVLLEDMKPLVMAELSKFLEIEEYGQNYDVGISEDQVNCQPKEEFTDYENDELYNFNENSQKNYSDDQTAQLLYNNIEDYTKGEFDDTYQYQNIDKEDKPLYERRTAIKYNDYSEERRQSSESRRKSLEKRPPSEPYKTSPKSVPLFDPSTENLTEEDPFAELDKQYHVPVNHNFIQADAYVSLQQSCASKTKPNDFQKEITNPSSSNEEIVSDQNNKTFETKIQSMSMSQINMPVNKSNEPNEDEAKISQNKNVHFNESSPDKTTTSLKSNNTDKVYLNLIDTKCENTSRTKYIDKKEPDKNEIYNSPVKSCTQSNSRKRSIDQRPSHRKEKRKKSESSPTQLNKELTYENNNISLCDSKSAEKDKDPRKLCIYSYFSKTRENKDITNVSKKVGATDKAYSDKYVRRKEIIKNKETESNKKRTNSLTSPKDSSNVCSLTLAKSDIKAKLKPINMFEEQSKKVHIHQAHRNTALPTFNVNKNVIAANKLKTTSTDNTAIESSIKRFIARETQTLCGKSSISKFCQTENKKVVVKSVQTDPVFFERFKTNSSDTLERMKEIDLEIQVLLQEKFKLYSSLENKGSCQNSMQTLGMTVLNVTPVEETTQEEISDNIIELSADSIVDDFTNIPVEELEQIAFESMKEDKITAQNKRTRRATTTTIEQESSPSGSVKRRSTKKAKTPNISLLEQIITDDRPLEEIILLDEFENSPVKKKSQLRKRKASKKSKKSLKHKIVPEYLYLKDCSVVLERLNIDKWLIDPYDGNYKDEPSLISTVIIESPLPHVVTIEPNKEFIEVQSQCQEIVEDDNNIQFDMLDVSEDIVIGDNCEFKSVDKDMNERIDVPITEEIILDNSQSSCDDLIPSDSGQGENECKMYDYSTDENLRRDSITVTGNADAVLAIECVDNNFIAASLDGNVYHFNSDGQLINTLRGSNLAVTCITIVKEKYGTTVYTGSLDSRIRYYDLETGVEKGPECNVLSPIQTMDRAWDTVFVGTRTGFVLQFECKNNMLIPVSTVKFSEQSILALRAMKEGPRKVLLVAARSENVTIKDAQTGLLLRTLIGPKMTVYTLLFEDGKVYCGTSSHQIHVFDYSTGGHVGSHEGGKGAVCLRATGGLVFAGCYDGCVYVYREGETRPLAQLRGPSLMLLSLAIVGSKIIAGYKDRSLYVWKIPLSILQEMIL